VKSDDLTLKFAQCTSLLKAVSHPTGIFPLCFVVTG